MNLSYLLRLLSLSFASFFVLNAVLTLLVRAVYGFALAHCAARSPRVAARNLFTLRILPAGLAAVFVLCLCIPSYLWFEPAVTAEQVGPLCAVLGILAATACTISVARSVGVLFDSRRFNRACASQHQETRLPGLPSSLFVLESPSPVLAMSGLLHPRLVISRAVLDALSSEELDVVLRHERSHQASHDNFKRLLFLVAPDFFPFARTLRNVEIHWSRFIEWAADDDAAAGDSHRGVTLAAALVRVARLGSSSALPLLSTSLLACDHDLSARVDRLLHPATAQQPRPTHRAWSIAGSVLFGAALVSTALLSPLALSSVHNLLERFLH